MCKCFDRRTSQVLDVQFGDGQTSLKLVASYSDGQIKIYELQDTLELEKWQLQAEFQNVWEFDLDHQRWAPVAELSLPEDKDNQVSSVAWASNIGRSYELIAVATQKGISIWHTRVKP
ncbi:hypothetical protein OROHE_016888 [Orobanche hederae]